MAGKIAILEDDLRRIEAMRQSLSGLQPDLDAFFFDDASAMIRWLDTELGTLVLISLDHDLPIRTTGGRTIDCGTGRDVADYLAARSPACPVIVHSSNPNGADAMVFALKNAGWSCSRVYPCDDLAWISAAWSEEVLRLAAPADP